MLNRPINKLFDIIDYVKINLSFFITSYNILKCGRFTKYLKILEEIGKYRANYLYQLIQKYRLGRRLKDCDATKTA